MSHVWATTDFSNRDMSTNQLDARAQRLHRLWLTMAPTHAQPRSGLRGRVVFRMQVLVRRLTYWYVEPRMEAQREIDAELARFATETAAALDAALREIDRLADLTDRLQRQLAATSQGGRTTREGSPT